MAEPSLSPSRALSLTPLLLTSTLLLLLVLTISPEGASARRMGPKPKVPALYIFGDSDVDVGNLPLLGLGGCAYPPYGQDYIPQSGRCSNGKVSVDFLASYLGLPPVPAGATFPYWNPNPKQGLNFAFGGSGALPETAKGVDLVAQAGMFGAVLTLNSSLAKTVPKSLFFILTGANDYMVYLESSPRPNLKKYQNRVIAKMVEAIKALYAAGARRFVVANIGTIGCYPIVIAKDDPTATVCVEKANSFARQYDAALAVAIEKVLRPQTPGATILEMDYYAIFDNIQTRPASFGFKNTLSCCGAPLPANALITCGTSPTVDGTVYNYTLCANPNNHIYWDFTHPSQATASIVAKYVWSGNTTYIRPFNVKELVSMR